MNSEQELVDMLAKRGMLTRRNLLKMGALGLGAAMVPQLLSSPLAFGQTQYEVEIVNNSGFTQTFFIFQSDSSSNAAEQFHTVQLTSRLDPRARGLLTWNLEYGLFWAPAPHYSPGIVLAPSQLLDVGLAQNNAATLEYANGTPNLTNLHTASPSGSLMLEVDNNVPLGSYAVGLAIDGKSVTAVPADANEHVVFTNPTSYAISVGPYEVGEALNPEVLNTYATLPFTNGATKVQVTLSQGPVGYSWTTEAVG